MVEWLREFRRKWKRAHGWRLFRRMCRTRDPLKRQQVRMVLEQQVMPPDELGWSRLVLEILKALAGGARQAASPRHLDECLGPCMVDFAVTYPGKVPNNIPVRELTSFAEREAQKLRTQFRT